MKRLHSTASLSVLKRGMKKDWDLEVLYLPLMDEGHGRISGILTDTDMKLLQIRMQFQTSHLTIRDTLSEDVRSLAGARVPTAL